MYEQLNQEQKLVMYLSRLSDTVPTDEVKEIIENGIDWDEVLSYGFKNKVMYYLYDNLVQLGFKSYIPKYLCALMEGACYCNIVKNNEKFAELDKVLQAVNEVGIELLPVKGAYLIDNVYYNRRARVTNDIDALILRKDVSKIDKIMKVLGYVVGQVDKEKNEIVVPNQMKKVLYKTKMYNLLPYVKPSKEVTNSFIMFDFSFALDFSLDLKPVEEMIQNSVMVNEKKQLLPEHFFVHMCCHHYREASHIEWIRIGKDLTIMKFCDVRSFVLTKMDKESMNRAVEFAKKNGLEKAIYFTLYFLKVMYNDGYEDEVLSQLNINDTEFLFKFSEDGKTLSNTRKKDFWSSIFNENNRDEIVDSKPTYDLVN